MSAARSEHAGAGDASSSAPRVALVGARRARQGLGPYVARSLVAHGAVVPAFVGTSEASVTSAAAGLADAFDIHARGYTRGAEMLEHEALDALAILSPAETHREWLQFALEAGLHVFVEKPLLWGGEDDAQHGAELLTRFHERGLLVLENCQWPMTVPCFDALHPGARAAAPQRFAMEMSPASQGVQMIGDALPHALSLLQALAPATREQLSDARFSARGEQLEELDLGFTWHADGHAVACMVSLRQGPEQPRRASYAVDDRWAHRLIRTRDYAQFFASGARVVDVPDPLDTLVGDFAARLRADPPVPDSVATGRMTRRLKALHELRRAYLEAP
ncbi:MAG: hypothetical protein DHS20C15_29320 [Planctomycetota bacterium]|nr:MAG: hypothetical protein DHS20C15_29320 [Planctomycetota bacterium]